MTEGKRITILDCTLRDGGYFNEWRFSRQLARDLVGALARSGVDVIEVGFKSPHTHKEKGFEGLFRYCTESELGFLREHRNVRYSFMVDAKELLKGDRADRDLVDECIPAGKSSVFSWVRIATYFSTLRGSVDLAAVLHDLGYRVTLNLMGMSLLTPAHLDQALDMAGSAPLEVFYFSDSFGDLQPADVHACMERIRSQYQGKIGIHTHDNNGLAFANTIAAIDLGIDMIDATLAGMGRGAGNLRTEQLLLYLYFRKGYSHLNPSELLEVIDTHLLPLKETYRWGWDYTYMVSALQNIHPTYCQNLRAGNQYTIEQVSEILNSIEPASRSAFDSAALLKAIEAVVNRPVMTEGPLIDLPPYRPSPEEKVLVIATGPGSDEYRGELASFIDQKDPLVIECNPKDAFFEGRSRRYLRAILNWVRLQKALDGAPGFSSPIVTGLQGIPRAYQGRAQVCRIPCHVGKNGVVVSEGGMTLPAYVVGMFAVGLAILSSPRVIYLAGYDGYPDRLSQNHQDMEHFWSNLKAPCPVRAITPTRYSLPVESVYRFIR